MKYAKIAVSIPAPLLMKVDRLVKSHRLPSRSFAIQQAIETELERVNKTSLAYACEQLDPKEERELAEEGAEDLAKWPQY